jgi:hypothetical protein
MAMNDEEETVHSKVVTHFGTLTGTCLILAVICGCLWNPLVLLGKNEYGLEK